ncbi:MAG: hypothetical protein U1C71_02390, partial [archaeon]|nr:hypothetical protein [archaeon]
MKIKSNEPVMGWKKGGEKMSQFKIYVGVLLVAMLFLAGCTSKPTYSDTENTASSGENDTVSQASAPSKQESKPEVSTLSIWSASMDNWDADPEVDGIKVTIQPENKEGK